MNDEELGSLKLLILKYRRVDQIIHPLCRIGSHPGFGIRKTKACDNRTPRHKNSEAIDVWKVACERLHATHQVGVSWRTMIIPLRKLQFSFFYNEIYELYNWTEIKTGLKGIPERVSQQKSTRKASQNIFYVHIAISQISRWFKAFLERFLQTKYSFYWSNL